MVIESCRHSLDQKLLDVNDTLVNTQRSLTLPPTWVTIAPVIHDDKKEAR